MVRLNLGVEGRALLQTSRESLRVLTSADFNDEAKERFVRSASLRVLGATGQFVLKLCLLAAVAFGLYSAATLWAPGMEPELSRAIRSPAVIADLSLVTALYVLVRHVVRRAL